MVEALIDIKTLWAFLSLFFSHYAHFVSKTGDACAHQSNMISLEIIFEFDVRSFHFRPLAWCECVYTVCCDVISSHF